MTWTVIPTKNPGDPVRAIDYNATNDNFEAMANGDSGAPPIKTAAIEAGAIATSGTLTITGGATDTLPAGLYNVVNYSGNIFLELFVGGSWRRSFDRIHGLVMSDGGTAVRFYGSGVGPNTIAYQKL